MDHGGSLWLREVVDRQSAQHSAALVDELAARLDSQLEQARTEAADAIEAATRASEAAAVAMEAAAVASEAAVVGARENTARDTRLAVAESLNQTLRRIRQAPTQAAVLGILLESTASYVRQAVVLEVENNQARSLAIRGGEPGQFSFPLEAAAAVAGVCETRDPLVAFASESELSPELIGALGIGHDAGDSVPKAYLFPVIARHEVVAVLVACGDPASPVMELLSEAAGMKIEALKPETFEALKPLSSSELIQIAPPSVPETASGAERVSWTDLSPEDQKLHLQAQRVARVKVAEMRLYHADELRKGVFESNIYGTLSSEIDRARADFLQTFLSKSPTMVDYLHIEILRSLAHEDDGLLGEEYPGPMV